MMYQFEHRRRYGLLVETLNTTVGCKTLRLFSENGPYVYFHREDAPGWALRRIWDFKLFAIHHVGPGKSTSPNGWHIRWVGWMVDRTYRSLSIRWWPADVYGCKDPNHNRKERRRNEKRYRKIQKNVERGVI